ncbi:MAG: adenylate/guanylate cyclase domain-containing protein [Gaiellaceae bacterium MAG52_C11]|nr:adenylate/guanylate cyclase domain-containing protein [Candidatus Gaiellasilicea maunaloa]
MARTHLTPAVRPTAWLLALPLAGLVLVLALPDADLRWQHNPAHFWLVLIAASVNVVLAYATGAAARRRGDGRVHLVSLAFLAAASFLALHALATPGVLLEKSNLGFAISTPIGLALAGALAAASALDLDRLGTGRVLTLSRWVERGLLVGIAVWIVVALAWTPDLEDVAVPERLSTPLVALSILGVALYAFAVVRYLALYRERNSSLLLAFAVAFTLLAEAMTAVAVARNWQLSWWEWHVLMLAGFALIAVGAHREWHEERFGALYLDRGESEVTVLFADLEGFTAFSEQHDADEVTRMLNTCFKTAIPAIERHNGRVDRLIGDAVMATFEGADDHPERAARAALALQEEAAAVAAARPGWPRFRVGLNTGSASAGVLGSLTGGRTYSVVGDTVNLASRIEGLAPAGGVAIGAATAARLRGAQLEPLGAVEVKGRAERVAVFLLRRLPG